MKIQVKPEAEKKLRQGYPWIMDNEVFELPRGFQQGTCVDFVNRKDEFLAFGYFNSKSRISGRVLTFDSTKKSITQNKKLSEHLVKCWQLRKERGFRGSFRLCFGESDFLPGLVIDYYLLDNHHQVFSIQMLTLGMQGLFADYLDILKEVVIQANQLGLTSTSWEDTSIVLRNDVNVRKYEGLEVDVPRVVRTLREIDLSKCQILVNEVAGLGALALTVDLYQGQKTGFFLDQTENIRRVVQYMSQRSKSLDTLRVLDLCCYVGHWSAQIARHLSILPVSASASESVSTREIRGVKCHLVDVSEKALAVAAKNVGVWTTEVETSRLNVLEELDTLPSQSYDLVIADPPAFVKSKKDLPTGKHAYAKLNAQAFRLVKPGGYVVSCSCSGLLEEDDFREALQKAQSRAQVRAQMILRGSISADHPALCSFPEAGYLKMVMNQVLD
ncbi:MAG: class I SAM-dependent rRNA methyltransferase [Bdellovibrionaceae bacterium]|nr:class I SAM-dependent rRNA methyltransferase [Pseudobdellovibrionaceae bacterium]